jgi:hypothetical protein
MKFSFTLVGLAALSMFAVTEAASAMPSGLTADGGAKTNVDQVRLVCDHYGRCYQTRGYGYRSGPRYGNGPRFDRHRGRGGHGGGGVWHPIGRMIQKKASALF